MLMGRTPPRSCRHRHSQVFVCYNHLHGSMSEFARTCQFSASEKDVRRLNLGSSQDEIVSSHKYSDFKPVVLLPAPDSLFTFDETSTKESVAMNHNTYQIRIVSVGASRRCKFKVHLDVLSTTFCDCNDHTTRSCRGSLPRSGYSSVFTMNV